MKRTMKRTRYTAAAIPFAHYPARPCIENAKHASEAVVRVCSDFATVKVLVLPAFVLTGAGEQGAVTDDLQPLIEVCRRHKVYLGLSDRFDGRQQGIILGPDGMLLSQAQVSDQSAPFEFHALDTEAGMLACLPGDDVCHPEYVRACLFKGAEIVLNPTVERADHRSDARHMSRAARCWESHVALISASATACVDADGTEMAGHSRLGKAELINHTGAILAQETDRVVTARIDLSSLRARRAEPWVNFPAQLRSDLYAAEYENVTAAPLTAAGETDGPVYQVLMMQTHEVFVGAPENRDRVIADNLDRFFGLAQVFAGNPNLRLIVLPEFALQGSTPGTLDYWEHMGIRIPGPETDRIAEFAKKNDVYIAFQVMEYDPDWPERWFNTAVIISNAGEVLLRYRKLQCADLNGLLNITTPGNIYSAYVKRYGRDALIPTVRTEIGVLGAAICFDSNWPELWRIMALKGVEVVCNPTSEIHSERVPYWWQAKRAHASENMYYVASANAGSEQFFEGGPVTAMNRGHSSLINFDGRLVAHADGPGVVPLVGTIDLGALRRARASTDENAIARYRPEAIVQAYKDFPGFPLDCFLDTPMREASEGPPLVMAQIDRLRAAGIFKHPEAA